MSAVWLAGPGALLAGLTLLLARRIISPIRYAQAAGGLALGLLVVLAVQHGGTPDAG